jgi:hypothetical protein
VFWEVVVSVIARKTVHMNTCLRLKGYQDRAVRMWLGLNRAQQREPGRVKCNQRRVSVDCCETPCLMFEVFKMPQV